MDVREPLVLIPGLMSNARLWACVMSDPLIRSRYAVQCFEPWEAEYQQTVQRFLAWVPAQFSLVVHGTGASFAHMALQYCQQRITRLYAVNPVWPEQYYPLHAPEIQALLRTSMHSQIDDVIHQILRSLVLNVSSRSSIAYMLREGGLWALHQQTELIKACLNTSALEIAVPTYQCVSMHDPWVRVPHPDQPVFGAVGHYLPLENPARVIHFLCHYANSEDAS